MRLSDFEEVILAVVIILSSLLPIFIFSRIRAFISGKNKKKDDRGTAEKRPENYQEPSPILNRLIMERREAQRRQEEASGIKTLEPRSLMDEVDTAEEYGPSLSASRRIRSSALKNTAWKRVNRLPPLKRAVVLSEVLAKPKALKEGLEE